MDKKQHLHRHLDEICAPSSKGHEFKILSSWPDFLFINESLFNRANE